ncbi:beta strand repeat-containing protein, partial [Pedobacter miscanthi]
NPATLNEVKLTQVSTTNANITLDITTGKVTVAPNTPAGTYEVVYQIEDKLNPGQTKTATVTVTVSAPAMLAVNDSGNSSGYTGGTAVENVLANDTYNGNPATLNEVKLTQVSTTNANVTLDITTGKVIVAPNTPAGTYEVIYQIEDKLNPGQTKTATVTVTVSAPAMLAVNDSVNANDYTGGTAVENVLANDTYNGNPATRNELKLTQVSTTDPKVILDVTTGKVIVAPNTPAGTYEVLYQIEDKLNPGQTKTATVTVTVSAPTMLAVNDSGNSNGYTGGTAVENVLANDTYNGNPATLNEVKLTQVSTTNANVTLDPATGRVIVTPNTPAGTYEVVYQIEDKLNPGQTKTANVTVTVSAPAMLAVNDSGNANGYTGGTAVENVLANDTYNGNPATLNEVKLTQVSTTDPKVILDVTTGKVIVAPNTPAGTYEVLYQIEDKLNPGQTKTATVTVTVSAPTMLAVNDSGNSNGYTGGTAVENVLANDTYNGNPATLNEVKLTQVSTTNANVTLDPATGRVIVTPNTPAGTYEVVYQIEDKLNPGQTKTANVTVTVSAPAMLAVNDSGNANGYTGGTAVENVLINDTYNGNPATLNEVKLTQVSTTDPKVSLDVATGKVIVAPNTPAGTYEIVYQIEDKLNPGQTKTATVTVTVSAPAMLAVNDSGNANGYTGGTALENVLINDTYNGNPATLNEVKLIQVSTTNANITLDITSGKVNATPNTPAGTYEVVYQIEDKLNPGQTKTATVTVTVSAPAMLAVNDSGNTNGYSGGTAVENVLANDTYNGNLATLNEVKLTHVSTTNAKVTLDPATGKVNVAPNTPAGVYEVVYQIEDKLNPGQTKTATVTVTVSVPVMVATVDSGNSNGYTGGTAVENVLANDTYNGNPATLNEVKLTQVSTTDPKVSLDVATGKVTVAPNTPAGTYEVVYQIEDKLNPGQTKTATVTVTVSAPAMLAVSDSGNANGYIGGTAVENVLINDTHNGNPATLNEVKLTQVSSTNAKVTLDITSGKVIVAPNTPAGTYEVVYQIEDKLNPGQTKTATVTVTVSAPAMLAVNDSGNANGYTGGTAVENVLANDTYNGNPATLNEVKLAQVSTTNANVTLDPDTGKVNVEPNTPAGMYEVVYQIEDKLNPGQTKTATVTVTVSAPAMLAVNDSGNANGYTGGTAVENVLINDTYNGSPATLNEVKLTQVSTTDPKVSLDVTTGKVNVAPNTPAGTYEVVYQIEDKLNPGQTKTATVTVTVSAPVMVAVNDSGNANGYTGGTAVENVLINDTYNGNPVTLNEVKLTQVSTINAKVTLDPATGKVNVAPNTPAGTYEVVYQIEDKLNPGQTKTATVTITVSAPAMLAVNDSGNANGYTGG